MFPMLKFQLWENIYLFLSSINKDSFFFISQHNPNLILSVLQ